MTNTPFGPALASYTSQDDFYADNHALAQGWNYKTHPGSAPLGWDLVPGVGRQDPRWLVVFCGPERNFGGDEPKGQGSVVAFDRDTGMFHVLAKDMDFPTAKAQYQS